MKVSDWLAVAGLVSTVLLTGVAGWTQLNARMSSMEEHLRNKEMVTQVTRQVMIETMRDVHELKGMHTEHRHTGVPVGDDEPVMAEAYLTESEM